MYKSDDESEDPELKSSVVVPSKNPEDRYKITSVESVKEEPPLLYFPTVIVNDVPAVVYVKLTETDPVVIER